MYNKRNTGKIYIIPQLPNFSLQPYASSCFEIKRISVLDSLFKKKILNLVVETYSKLTSSCKEKRE